MRLAFLFLLGIASFLANANNPVLVCRKDQSDGCKCQLQNREVLIIQCEKLASLNTTYITVPDSLMTNVVSVEIIFDKTGITQITSPFLPKKLSNLLRNFYIQGSNIEKIDANVFDGIKLERLDLSGNNIGDSALNNGWLTPSLGKTLKTLYLSRNNFTELSKALFDKFALLEQLDLSFNRITRISDTVFNNLPKLNILSLNNNKITQIFGDSFGTLSQLSILYLGNNEIREISENAFIKLPNLQSLSLSKNKLTKIPASNCFAKPNGIIFLYLNSNKIKEIQKNAFESFGQLLKVYLSENEIGQISETAFDGAVHLQSLDLNFNQITKIENGTFKVLKQLTYLGLTNNSIENIGVGTFDGLDSIYQIDLNNNMIRQISSKTFNGLKSLFSIYLDHNQVETIDDGSFDQLGRLNQITLDYNPKLSLTDRTFGFNGPISLTELSLRGCTLKSLPNGLLKNLSQLIYLDIRNNEFSSVPTALRNTKSLEILRLEYNDITHISANAFGNNPSLTELYLDNLDKLSVVDSCAFCGLKQMGTCSLNNNNNLKQINENAFGFSKNATDRTFNIGKILIHDGGLKTVPFKLLPWEKMRISILGNPANCDSRMDWLFRNEKYNIDTKPSPRYYDRSWYEQCRHDRVCQKLYGWTTTKSPG